MRPFEKSEAVFGKLTNRTPSLGSCSRDRRVEEGLIVVGDCEVGLEWDGGVGNV